MIVKRIIEIDVHPIDRKQCGILCPYIAENPVNEIGYVCQLSGAELESKDDEWFPRCQSCINAEIEYSKLKGDKNDDH